MPEITTCDFIITLFFNTTSFPITENGPISQFGPTTAPLLIIAEECIFAVL
jgi:hypothetical protein